MSRSCTRNCLTPLLFYRSLIYWPLSTTSQGGRYPFHCLTALVIPSYFESASTELQLLVACTAFVRHPLVTWLIALNCPLQLTALLYATLNRSLIGAGLLHDHFVPCCHGSYSKSLWHSNHLDAGHSFNHLELLGSIMHHRMFGTPCSGDWAGFSHSTDHPMPLQPGR